MHYEFLRHSVTLYNLHTIQGKKLWYPTILENVFLTTDNGYLRRMYGTDLNVKSLLIIDYALTEAIGFDKRKSYIPIRLWKELIDDERSNYWTLAPHHVYTLGDYPQGRATEDITSIQNSHDNYVIQSFSEKKDFNGDVTRWEILAV